MNNIAYANAVARDTSLLQEADEYSAQAFKALSWVPAIRGTRGTVLIELGRIEEAIPLLESSLEMAEEAEGRAQNCSLLAIAEASRGKLHEARAYFNEALRLDPQCFLLGRVESAIAEREALQILHS